MSLEARKTYAEFMRTEAKYIDETFVKRKDKKSSFATLQHDPENIEYSIYEVDLYEKKKKTGRSIVFK